MSYFDFNDAEQQHEYDIIPKGTLAKVRMLVRPGGYDDPSQGWTGGWAKYSPNTGAVYLSCEAVVIEGEFSRRKVWFNIGLYSAKGPDWGNMGRSLVRAMLNSAKGILPGDNSPRAMEARRIKGFEDLNGLVFVARIDLEADAKGGHKNTIKNAIEPGHKDYAAIMGTVTMPSPAAQPSSNGKPPWATGNIPVDAMF